MNLIANIKAYFEKKEQNKKTGDAPEGVCPNCWGTLEYDGEYYSFMKGQKNAPSEATYTSFIAEVARKLEKITIKEDTYVCESCKVDFKNKQ